ncbi:MAG: hypothetical protein KY393_00105 [Actinobacteria bacterium]|nr:hypothetical protein [Actinomycetota bacterium]
MSILLATSVPNTGNAWDDWFYVVAPFLFYLTVVYFLTAFGRSDKKNILPHFFGRISDSLRRATGYPGWAMAGALSGLLVLLVAAMGLYWDVAWHIDLGRDELLLNPSHTMIVLGLGGLMYAAAIAITFATLDDADVGFKYKGLRIPWSAVPLFALGLGGLASFPFDELWHQAYGLDVTLWSPTHLQLLIGGGFATLAVWLMVAEGSRGHTPTSAGRFIHIMVAGAALVGLTIFQGEFDFMVPQFQLAYYPILVMIAGGFILTMARIALGPWGALKAVLFYLAVRGFLVLIVTGALNHTFTHFPTYLIPALAVEAVAFMVGTQHRTRFALAAGAAVGTVGLAAELVWLPMSGWMELSPALLPKAVPLSIVGAVAAAVLGARMGNSFSSGERTVSTALVVAAGVAVVAVLAVPLPRQAGDVEATITLVDRQDDVAKIQVELDPPDAAEEATLFGVMSNQGGSRVVPSRLIPLDEPGTYISENAHPVSGEWKTSVGLQRGDEVMSAPVYLPADPEIGASEVPALPERTVEFGVVTEIMLREAHDGPVWPSVVAYTEVVTMLAVWIFLFALADRKIKEDRTRGESKPSQPTQPVG